MSKSNQSPLDQYEDDLRRMSDPLLGHTNAEIAADLRAKYGLVTSEASIRRAKKRLGIASTKVEDPDKKFAPRKKPLIEKKGDIATLYSPDSKKPPTEEGLMALCEIDTETNEQYGDTEITAWGNPENLNYRMKIKVRKKIPLEVIIPAREIGAYIAPPPVVQARDVKTVLLYGDQQCPFIDWDIFGSMLNLTKEFRPDMIIDPGDGRDFPSVSHHRTWPEWRASAQESIDVKYTVDKEMRIANEDAEIIQFLGNHDIRLASYLLEKAPAAYGITPGCAPDEERLQEAYSIRNLGRLDELRIELVSNEKEAYDQARFMVSDLLGVEHGNKTGKDPAIKAQHRRTFSIIMGHTHGQSINHIVNYDHNNEAQVHVAIETGTGAVRDRGIGFAPNPNWVGGGIWVSLHKDGSFHAEPITKKASGLHFRDKRF